MITTTTFLFLGGRRGVIKLVNNKTTVTAPTLIIFYYYFILLIFNSFLLKFLLNFYILSPKKYNNKFFYIKKPLTHSFTHNQSNRYFLYYLYAKLRRWRLHSSSAAINNVQNSLKIKKNNKNFITNEKNKFHYTHDSTVNSTWNFFHFFLSNKNLFYFFYSAHFFINTLYIFSAHFFFIKKLNKFFVVWGLYVLKNVL